MQLLAFCIAKKKVSARVSVLNIKNILFPTPHFHTIYGEYIALFNIDSLEIIEGDLPPLE
jgi:hypothetical protein